MQTPLSYCFHFCLFYLQRSLSYFLSYHKKTKITICFPADSRGTLLIRFLALKFFPISNWHTIGTTLAQFCSFPVKASMLYLVQSKICKAAVFHSGRRLFSSERRWFYFVPNYQSSRQGVSPEGQARQEPGGHTKK